MATLILLNGTPATGKSTLARAWAAAHPLALVLDIDVVRSMLGGWQHDPLAAGLAARAIALEMIAVHLRQGHDVIVPQYLARPAFVEALEQAAGSAGAAFAEVVLRSDPEAARRRFAARAAAGDGNGDIHGPFVGTSMHVVVERHEAFVRTRPRAILLAPEEGAEFVTVAALESALAVPRR